jgi:APA family basic amino acid/polyamine antiporter
VRVPAYPLLPAVYLITTALIALALLIEKTTYSGLGLACVLLGVPVYVLWNAANRRDRLSSRAPQIGDNPRAG